MEKGFLGLVAFLGLIGLSAQTNTCAVGPKEDIRNIKWPDMKATCVDKVKEHIKVELTASMTYLAMGAHFLNSAQFRPGLAKMVLKHAGEERQHARGLMDYLLMRGEEITKNEIPSLEPLKTSWDSVYAALNDTLTLELEVRDAFKKIIFLCEGGEDADHSDVDYHISDFLTGNFLEEQHQGVREISSLLSTLTRMNSGTDNSVLAELEFDRTLLHD